MKKTMKDLGYPTEPYGRIPAFHNIEEDAEFWDAHDISDCDEVELRPVHVTVGPDVGNSLLLRIPQKDRTELDRIARARGTDVATLVEHWLNDCHYEGLKKSA
jgi:hypothetical protein